MPPPAGPAPDEPREDERVDDERGAVGWEVARGIAWSGGPLAGAGVPLQEALGCVLAADVVARSDLPSADTSAMDGWVVRGDPPWRVVGRALAGHDPGSRLTSSRAMVIATGAPVPPGATGIVRSERGVLDGDLLTTAAPVDLSDVRRRGHEARCGEVVLARGATVTPVVLGLAAAAGHDTLTVHPRPRVSVLTLGDELLDAGPSRGGVVRDSLGVQLPAWVAALGGEPLAVRRVPDRLDETRKAVAHADGEVVVTTGGSAHGAADHLRAALAELGGRITVDTVDVRPGHPMILATLPDGRRLVGLPGNPLAALVGVVTLLSPLVAGLRGAPLPAVGRAVTGHDVPVRGGRRARGAVVVPVARGSRGEVAATGYGASSMLRGVATAEGFLLVPPGGLRAGERADVAWFPWVTP